MFSALIFDPLGINSQPVPEIHPAEMEPEMLAHQINQNVAAIGKVATRILRLAESDPHNPAPGQGAH